jgi:hypothetical protein
MKFFVWEEKRTDKFKTFKCLLCLPRDVFRIKSHSTALSHLRSHITRKHESHVQDFDAALPRSGAVEGSAPDSLRQLPKRGSLPLIEAFASGSGALQTGVNKRIVDLFVSQMLALQVRCI